LELDVNTIELCDGAGMTMRARGRASAVRAPAYEREVVIRPNAPTLAGLRLLVIANRCMTPLYNELERRCGLSRDEAVVIISLSITTAATAQHVARYSGRPKNSISRAVVALEEKGLIRRSAHPEDGRASCLELTPAGHKMFKDIKGDHAAADERLLSALAPEERKLFVDMLAKIALATIDWD
jgi:DNA-binding MarR family transcriptional regulator